MKIYFINPNLVVQKGDFLGSGIPYMPHILAYTVGLVKQNNYPVKVIDSFGENPTKINTHQDTYWQGITIREILQKLHHPTSIFLYASAITNLDFNILLIKKIKSKFPHTPLIVLANTQAVTSFDITLTAKRLLGSDKADFIIYNNIENTTLKLIRSKYSPQNIDNLIFLNSAKLTITPMSQEIGETKSLLVPSWEEFPIANYWRLGYSHGPYTKSYLPVLSSYGCPFHCQFCVNPGINKSRWQAKTAVNVFKELKYLKEKFHVCQFHFEDLNPTVDKKRISDLCRLLIKNQLNINWRLVSGTKVETIDPSTLELMRQAGCDYISISPESGSKKILKLMGKPFDFIHADKFIKQCKSLGIKTQACFVLGFPGENSKDLRLTSKYVYKITKIGIDEIALFIASPIPGSALFNNLKGFRHFSQLTFSPKWRKDYRIIEAKRSKIYLQFIIFKYIFHPFTLITQAANFLTHHFKTKMEMIPYRILRFKLLLFKNYGNLK